MNLLPERKIKLPASLPADIKNRLRGRRITFVNSKGARMRARSPERILPSDWNEKYRVMPSSESFPGKWRRDIAPHAAAVMDMWAMPSVRELWFCGPDQASKTSSMLGCLGWAIDQDPGNTFYTASGEGKTKEIVTDKLVPMLRESPKLAKFISSRVDDTVSGKIRLKNGVHIRVAWANSPSSTASFSAKYTFNDEVDKWSMIGKETDPIRRIRKRAKNFPSTHKHFFASTPAGKYIYKGMLACQKVYDYAGRCPDCGELILMDEEHFILDGLTIDDIKSKPSLVEYSCACGSLWDETKRLHAYRTGKFVCTKGEGIRNPVDIGVHLSGFITPDMKMSDIATTILEAKAGDLSAQRDLAHGIKAIDYTTQLADRKEDYILRLCDDRTEGQLPAVPIAAITAVADMQKRGFWYTIRAWGYGLAAESWLLKTGFVDSWEALEHVFFRSQFVSAVGDVHTPTLWGIDSGGGESEEYADMSRTAECYLFCVKNPGVIPFKGNSRMQQIYTRTVIDKLPGTNRPVPGTVALHNVNSRIFKNRLASKLMVEPADPGAWHIHSGLRDEDIEVGNPREFGRENLRPFAAQMCAESLDGVNWVNPTKRANHLWDCSYYEMALYEIAQVKFWPPPDSHPVESTLSKTKREKSRRW